MARVDADIPKSWNTKLEDIMKKRSISKRQLVKDAIYEKYIKEKPSDE